MNILRVMGCPSYNYASQEKYMVMLSKELGKRGHNFFLVYENIPENKKFIKDLRTVGTKLIRITPRRNILRKVKNRFIKKLLKPFYNLFDLPSIVKCSMVIEKYKIDIVHSYFSPSLYAIFIGKLKGKKTCRTLSNSRFPKPVNSKPSLTKEISYLVRTIMPLLFIDRQIAISKSIEKEIGNYIWNKSKLELIFSGVNSYLYDPTKFDNNYLRKELGFNFSHFLIGYTGRLEATQKNLFFTLKIIKVVSKQYNNMRFILVGDGPDKKRLIEECKALGISDVVIFLGRRSDIPPILKDLDLYLITSLYEGLPSSLMEAMSMEVPCVTGDIPVFKEIIENNKNGFICSLGDKKDFANIIKKLIKEPSLRNTIGRQARKTIIERFEVRDRTRKTIRLYESL